MWDDFISKPNDFLKFTLLLWFSSINKGFQQKPVLGFRFMFCADFYERKCHFSDQFLHNVHANFKMSHNMTPDFDKLILWFYCFFRFPQPWLSKLNWKLQRSKNIYSLSMAYCSFWKLWYFFQEMQCVLSMMILLNLTF